MGGKVLLGSLGLLLPIWPMLKGSSSRSSSQRQQKPSWETPRRAWHTFGTLEAKIKTQPSFCLKKTIKSQKPCFYAGFSDKDLKTNWPQALSANPNSLCCPQDNLLLYLDTPRWDVTSFLSPCPRVSQTPPKRPWCPQPLRARCPPSWSMSTVDHLPCCHLFSGAFP